MQTVAFTRNAPLYMDACDILLSKPGGLTSTEAAVQNIPLVHTRPIPGCETANARFFVSHGLSVCAVHPKAAALAAASLAEDTAALQRMTECQKREINPNAAEEIAAIILSGMYQAMMGQKLRRSGLSPAPGFNPLFSVRCPELFRAAQPSV